MFCPKCGKEIEDDAVICVHCGRPLEMNYHVHNQNQVRPEHNEPKTGLGVLMGLFLGVIGLLIGVIMFPEGTVARKTFMKAWIITFIIVTVISVVASFVFTMLSMKFFDSIYYEASSLLIRY